MKKNLLYLTQSYFLKEESGDYVFFTDFRKINNNIFFIVEIQKTCFYCNVQKSCTEAEFNRLKIFLTKITKNNVCGKEEWYNYDNSIHLSIIESYYHEYFMSIKISDNENKGVFNLKLPPVSGKFIVSQTKGSEFPFKPFPNQFSLNVEVLKRKLMGLIPLDKEERDDSMEFDEFFLDISNTLCHIKQTLSIPKIDYDDICEGLYLLLLQKIPYTINVLNYFIYISIVPVANENNLFDICGDIADSEWEQNEVSFKGFIDRNQLANLYHSFSKIKDLPVILR